MKFIQTARVGIVVLAVFAANMLCGCGGTVDGSVQVTGQIEGVTVTAGSKIGGRVKEVLVKEGDAVKVGDVLIKLDDAETQAAMAAATAQLAALDAQLTKVETGATAEQLQQAEAAAKAAEEQYTLAKKGARVEEVRAVKAALDAAAAQLEQAKIDFARAEKLLKEGAATQRQYDQARTLLDTAEAQHRAAKEKYGIATSGLRNEEVEAAKAVYDRAAAALAEIRRGAREEDRAAARAARDAAAADLERAKVALDEMTIISPINGVVESLDIHPGDLIKPGAVVRLVDPEDLELVVYVSAVMLGKIQLGQKLTLTSDAHGPETFQGEIIHIAAQGEYTPRNLQTQEERVQQVFGVKLKLNSHGGKLRAGMTVTAQLPKAGPAAQ